LIGTVRARGLSTVQLAIDIEIEAELRRKYIKDPKVSVEVEAYRPSLSWARSGGPGSIPTSMR
jgi:polysaccharide biosynthesis/export protein